MTEPTPPPPIQVTSGALTPEELAAVVVVLQSRPGTPAAPAAEGSGWSAHWRRVRTPLTPGPDAWRSSGWR